MTPRIARTLAVALVAAALVPTSAAAAVNLYGTGVYRPPMNVHATSATRVTAGGEQSGPAPSRGGSDFSWGDAAIGAGAAVVLIAAGAAVRAASRGPSGRTARGARRSPAAG